MATLLVHPATEEFQKPTARTSGNKGQGMNWITQKKRLALYLRDGLACVYCQQGVEDGIQLSLDHLLPRSHGGAEGGKLSDEKNLVTCCITCNSKRQDRSVGEFAKAVAAYNGTNVVDVLKRVRNAVRRKLDLPRAQELIELRGSCAKVIAVLPLYS